MIHRLIPVLTLAGMAVLISWLAIQKHRTNKQQYSQGEVQGVGWKRRSDASRFSESELQTTRDIEEASSVDDAPPKLRALYVAAFITPAAKSLMKKGAGNAHKLQRVIEDASEDD